MSARRELPKDTEKWLDAIDDWSRSHGIDPGVGGVIFERHGMQEEDKLFVYPGKGEKAWEVSGQLGEIGDWLAEHAFRLSEKRPVLAPWPYADHVFRAYEPDDTALVLLKLRWHGQ